MNGIVRIVRTRLGDFWFHSLVLFLSMRIADALNLFVGAYLVPRYIGPGELGAVMPLASFASLLSLPVMVFAMVFLKEVNALANAGEFGRMKSLMRGVFVWAGIFLVLAVAVSRTLMPLVLERIRVAEGALGFLILVSSFLGCVSPVYTNALQALKRFKALSVINVLGAPLRLIAMMLTMPIRALSGYFVGQSVSPAFAIGASVWALRKDLSIAAEPYWTRPVIRRFLWMFCCIAVYQGSSMLVGFVQQTVLRQRVPEIESAAFYMVSRFSDVGSFLVSTLSLTIFPYAAELDSRGESVGPLLNRSILAIGGTTALLMVFFLFAGAPIMRLLPDGDSYAAFAGTIPVLLAITTLNGIAYLRVNTEIACGRFSFVRWWLPFHLAFAVAYVVVPGYSWFGDLLPAALRDFLAVHNLKSLNVMLVWMTVESVGRFLLTYCNSKGRNKSQDDD